VRGVGWGGGAEGETWRCVVGGAAGAGRVGWGGGVDGRALRRRLQWRERGRTTLSVAGVETPHPDADYLPLLLNSIKLLCCWRGRAADLRVLDGVYGRRRVRGRSDCGCGLRAAARRGRNRAKGLRGGRKRASGGGSEALRCRRRAVGGAVWAALAPTDRSAPRRSRGAS
jgi:hypothetical protein